MKACLIAFAALLCGAAWGQGGTPADPGAICRSFCDADANQCRKSAAASVDNARHGGLPMIMGQSVPSDSYDFTGEKRQQADRSDDRDRAALSQHCSDQRFDCRRKCTPAPAAASAAR
jgi:hypothetical protein